MKQTMFFVREGTTKEDIDSQIEYCKKRLLHANTKISVFNVKKEIIVEYTIEGYTSAETKELYGPK
jgi:hypothetical protein